MTDLLATQKTGDEGLRIQQRPRRLADRAWLLGVPGVCCLEATDRVVVGCRKCVPTRARGEREGGAVSSGCWLRCALGNGRRTTSLPSAGLGWAALDSTGGGGAVGSWPLAVSDRLPWLRSPDPGC